MYIRRTILAVAFLLVPTSSGSAPQSLDFCSGWSVGQQLDFVARRVDEARAAGKPATRVVSSLPVQVDVIDQDASGFKIAWTYGTTTIEENTEGPLAGWALSLFDGLRVELRTDAAGRVKSVANARTVKEFLIVTRRRMAAELEEIEVASEQRELLSRVLHVLTEPQRSANLPLPDAEFLLQICGQSLAPGQRRSVAPASAAFEVFERKVSFVLRAVDRAATRATIEWRNEEDPRAKEFLGALFRLIAEAQGNPRQRLQIRDAGTIEFDFASGWPERVTHDRSVRFGKTVERIRTEIERVPHDPT
jgi:hypothetical protein